MTVAAKTKIQLDAEKIKPLIDAAKNGKTTAAIAKEAFESAAETVTAVKEKVVIDPERLAAAKKIAAESAAALEASSKASGADTLPETKTPEQAATAAEPVKKSGGLFADIKRSTEEDKQPGGKLSDIVTSATDTPDVSNLEDDSPELKKANAEISAMVAVEAIDIVFMLICMLLTWDFSEDNQKTYTLHKDRKKAIKDPIIRMLMVRKKKSKPGPMLFWLILGSYAPMLVIAILAMITRLRGKQKKDAEASTLTEANIHNDALIKSLRENQIQIENVQRENAELRAQAQFNFENQHLKPATLQRYKTNELHRESPAKKTAARRKHLNWCKSFIGKPCNCRNYTHKPNCASFGGKKCNCHK